MSILKKLNSKKKEMEDLLNIKNFNDIKQSRLLKLLANDIVKLHTILSIKEINNYINTVFEIDIKYSYFYQFFNKYCKYANQNKGVNKIDNKSSNKNKKTNEVSTGATTPVDKKNNKTKKNIISEEYKEIADSYGNCFKNNDNE